MRVGYDRYDSPIGPIHVIVDEKGVRRIVLFEEDWEEYRQLDDSIPQDSLLCEEVITQLKEYFAGQRKEFDLALSVEGTDFRKKVWNALRDIPYGEVRNYLDIAEAIQNPKAVRAVGQANRNNQIPIIIPCHRVIGKSGELVGFAGSRTPTQRQLLKLEGFNV
ncbi:methylated-DNA--[protein]-cysteine S-methyltransferase [Bacillus timonensis]|nr:methylated-DNA--[protein]-cysteine S-methyltransferase [Bacillus timonensis]